MNNEFGGRLRLQQRTTDVHDLDQAGVPGETEPRATDHNANGKAGWTVVEFHERLAGETIFGPSKAVPVGGQALSGTTPKGKPDAFDIRRAAATPKCIGIVGLISLVKCAFLGGALR